MGVSNLLRDYVNLLVEARQPFDLKVFRGLTEDDAVEYLDFHAKVLGSGAGRTVYDVGRGWVIKWAYNANGIEQNRDEASRRKCAAPNAPIVHVLVKAPNYQWVISNKVKPVVGASLGRALKATVGMSDTSDLMFIIETSIHQAEGYELGIDDAEALRAHERLYHTNEWYRALYDTVKACKINPMELHDDNWGLDDKGRLVLLDTGG